MVRWGAKHETAYRALSGTAADADFRYRSDSDLGSQNLSLALPRAQWGQALALPDIDNIQQMLFHYSLHASDHLVAGRGGVWAGGCSFQQVLRNPLAEPTTLGVATGAQLGITITTLWALPGVLTSQFAALVGACVVGALVFGVAWGKRSPP